MSRPERRKYALANYSVELRERGWYFGEQFDAAGAYHGPYASIASVTLVIARQLRREIERRHRRVLASSAGAADEQAGGEGGDNADSPRAHPSDVPF